LIDEFRESEDLLWCEVEESTEGRQATGITDGLLKKIAQILEGEWKCEVDCVAVCHREITDENAADVLGQFLEVLPTDRNEELLLDMTHAFRTFPMLAFSAIQIAEAFTPGLFSRTRLVYGDLHRFAAQKAMPERQGGDVAEGAGIILTSIREFAQVAHAAAIFENTLDPEPLSRELERFGEKLPNALRKLGIALSSNAYRRLNERMQEIRNAFRELQAKEEKPPYFNLLHKRISAFLDALDQNSFPLQLSALASQRAQRGDYAQAILALYEAFCSQACPQPVESFTALQEIVHRYADSLKGRKREAYDRLRELRNSVAHGARLVSTNQSITEQTIKRKYEEAKKLLDELLR
jgi:hypothetical protein